MSSWVRRDFDGIGLTQAPPGPYLRVLQERYGGHVLLCLDVSFSMAGERLRQAVTGAAEFLDEAEEAHYECGLVLWSDSVVSCVPPGDGRQQVLNALRTAKVTGGTRLAPALRRGIEVLAERRGDRVLCLFSDGQLADQSEAVELARRACASGIRIIVRGLGGPAAASLGDLACPGAADDGQEITAAADVPSGIASMARGLTTRPGSHE